MVRYEYVEKFYSGECDEWYFSGQEAEACEKRHTEGFVKKIHIGGKYNIHEYKSVYSLGDDDADAAFHTLIDVEVLVKFQRGEDPKIIAAEGYYLDDNEPYNPEEFD